MPGPSDSLDVDRLAARLKASRETFAAAFNAFAEARPGEVSRFEVIARRRQARRPLAAVAGRNAADMRAALDYAQDKGFLRDLCATAGEVLFSAPKDGGAGDVVVAAAAAGDAATRDSIRVSFQAIVNDREAFRDPDKVMEGIMRARRRTCRILVRQGDDLVTGSGFLIGPRLVLTNWHVVQSLLLPLDDASAAARRLARPEAWQIAPGSAAALSVEFDFIAQAGGSTKVGASPNWLVAASRAQGAEYGRHDDAAAGDAPAGDASPGDVSADDTSAVWPADPSAFDPFDDFAVIEIAEPAGFDRGYYDIISSAPPAPRGNMLVLHHPGQFAMRLSVGSFDVGAQFDGLLGNPPRTTARVLHNANSIGGSSGGPCFDWDLRPVALHQAGIEFGAASDLSDDKGVRLRNAVVNVAIPLGRICAKAGPAILERMGRLKALRPLLGNGDPLIGRDELQEAIAQAQNGDVKIIIVRPDFDIATDGKPFRKVGKSFSRRILKDQLREFGQHAIIELSAASLLTNAFRAAVVILNAVDSTSAAGLTPVEDQTLTPERQSTEVNDIVARIAAELKAKLVAAAAGRTLWIAIDDLETYTLLDNSTRALLDRLYADVAAEPSLRLVLIGLADVDLPSLQGIRAKRIEAPLTHPDVPRIRQWLANRADDTLVFPDVARDCIAGMVISAAKQKSGEALSLSEAVTAVVKSELEPHFRKR